MKPILHLLRLLLLICLLSVKSQAQDGPICNPSLRATGLRSVILRVYSDGNKVYAACYDAFAGGLGISTDGGVSFDFKTTANGLGSNAVRAVYAVGSTVYAATTGVPELGIVGGLSISTDGGNKFTYRTTANGLGSNNINDVYAVGNTVYAATDGGVSISTDGGITFINHTTGLGNNYVSGIYALGNTVYAATNGGATSSIGGVSISTDGGTTFKNYTTGLGSNYVTGVYAVGNTVYAATDGGVSISTDGGTTFTNHTTGLGSNLVTQVYVIGTTIYASTGGDGTNGGVSISTDGGDSFTNYTSFMSGTTSNNSVSGVFAAGAKVFAAGSSGLFSCTDSGLPVSLVSFTAQVQPDRTVLVSWQTSWEKTNDHFEIQRSTDAKSFESIGRIAGKGTQQAITDYSFTDEQMPGELAYYRLKQVDTDGTHTFSSIISVRRGVDSRLTSLAITPNPVQKTLTLNLSAGQVKAVRIFDLAGRLIQTALTLTPDISGLGAGSYVVEVTTTSGQVLKQRFIKE